MNKEKMKEYESPSTKKTQVELEEGVCAASKEKVVVNDQNTTVDINKHQVGGDFELENWN